MPSLVLTHIRELGITVAGVGDVEAASLEDDRYGAENPAGLIFALGALGHRRIVEPLPFLKLVVADITFILINRHNLKHLDRK
jgi:hypothetical protein